MPLPPALLNRLKKRGIIKQVEANEEIIAENYDDETTTLPASVVAGPHILATALPTDSVQYSDGSTGAPGCPNKCNPFHLCSDWCKDHWGDGTPENKIDPDYDRRRLRMLKKYPIPAPWKEIYDPGVGRYYYWNTETDEVCWLSPSHPKAKITVAACRVAKNEWERINREMALQSAKNAALAIESDRKRRDSYDSSSSESDDERRRPSKRTGGKSKDKWGIDPMDPAAYSDVPRGKWSTGLESRGDAKTGVDTTASGPLFQQRPYPAPGAILRQNMESQKSKKRDK